MSDKVGNIDAGGVLSEVYSPITGSVISGAESSRLAFEGKVWTSKRILNIPNGVSELVFDPLLAVNKDVVVLPPSFSVISDDTVILTTYLGATYSGGTNQIIRNRNQNIVTQPLSLIKYGVTIGSPGVERFQYLLASSSQGNFATSGMSTDPIIVPINNTLVTRISINNTGALPGLLEYTLNWSEFDPIV